MDKSNPGWYKDPRVAGGLLAYWDGEAWTDNRQPIPADILRLEARTKPNTAVRIFVAFALLFPTCGLSLIALVPRTTALEKRRTALAKQHIYV